MKIERTLSSPKLYTFQELKPGDVFHPKNSPILHLKVFDTDNDYINAINLITNVTVKITSTEPQFVLLPDAELVV